MPEETLRSLLRAVGHVGEVARVLSMLAVHGGMLRERELVTLVARTAGSGHRYPRPVPALGVACQLGLIKRTVGRVRLTENGRQFSRNRSPVLTDLSPFQGELLLGLFLDDEEMRVRVLTLVGKLREGEGGQLQIRTSTIASEGLAETSQLLHQLGALQYQDGVLVATPAAEVLVAAGMAGVGLSEASLWERLEAQRLRAVEIEKRVVEEEKLRLTQKGRRDLADAVFRVSELNVGAGYDIESFEVDGSRRYIEVKSSTGRQIRFQWSLNEREKAQSFGRQYWIYFVPTAHLVPPEFCPTVMIRDPAALVRLGLFRENPSAFEVVEESRTPIDNQIQFSVACRMAEFWLPVRRDRSRRSRP